MYLPELLSLESSASLAPSLTPMSACSYIHTTVSFGEIRRGIVLLPFIHIFFKKRRGIVFLRKSIYLPVVGCKLPTFEREICIVCIWNVSLRDKHKNNGIGVCKDVYIFLLVMSFSWSEMEKHHELKSVNGYGRTITTKIFGKLNRDIYYIKACF